MIGFDLPSRIYDQQQVFGVCEDVSGVLEVRAA